MLYQSLHGLVMSVTEDTEDREELGLGDGEIYCSESASMQSCSLITCSSLCEVM